MGLGERLQAYRGAEDRLFFRPADVPDAARGLRGAATTTGETDRPLEIGAGRTPLLSRRRSTRSTGAAVRDLRLSESACPVLRSIGTRCSTKRVARLMREAGLYRAAACAAGEEGPPAGRGKRAAPACRGSREEELRCLEGGQGLGGRHNNLLVHSGDEGFLYLAFSSLTSTPPGASWAGPWKVI